MKRGFLNSRKAKARPPLYGSAASASNPPQFKETITLCQIPSLSHTNSKEPSSACLIRDITSVVVFNTQGYYTPLPANPSDGVFTKTTPDMGIGLFAKRATRLSQMVFAERPLLVCPKEFNCSQVEDGVINESHLAWENLLRKALGLMTPEDADAFQSLHNCHPESPELLGITWTNAFAITPIEEEDQRTGKASYTAVGKLGSMINHSCTPNVENRFDIPTFALQFFALRDIQAGEQLFYSYCGSTTQSAEKRQRHLTGYGFVCQCRVCINATPASDRFREELYDRIQNIFDEREAMFSDPQFSIGSLDRLLQLEKDTVEEGLDNEACFLQLLYVIAEAYRRLQNTAKNLEYLKRAFKYLGKPSST